MKQIVGGTLTDEGAIENFATDRSAGEFAAMYRRDGLTGGHLVRLGGGNDGAARDALAAYPGGLQIGGGITPDNAAEWIDAGASHVIVTSCLFDDSGKLHDDNIERLKRAVGGERLVFDLSCRRRGEDYFVTTNRWQTWTQTRVDPETVGRLESMCDEFLVHAADVEGLCGGVEVNLVERLSAMQTIPITYAGGIATMKDIELIADVSGGRMDYTVGSALDLFGGHGVRYQDLVPSHGAFRR